MTDETDWPDWEAAQRQDARASGLVLQRVTRADESLGSHAVGIGHAEKLVWFGPIKDAHSRRLIVGYAGDVLEAGDFPTPGPELQALSRTREIARPAAPADAQPPATEGIVLLSHAGTDLLGLERARSRLPEGFPPVAGHSLVGLADETALHALLGGRRTARLFVIVRIHGTVASVPGLAGLAALAQAEGWGLAVISGVEGPGGIPSLPHSAGVPPPLAADLTAYFMAGGADNVAQALRRVAAHHLGLDVSHAAPRAMPAHGLYHPDLLVTDAEEWREHARAAQAAARVAAHAATHVPLAIVLFYRAHVQSGNLEFVDCAVRALERRGFAALGVFTSSLRDRDPDAMPLALRLLDEPPDIIVNTVNFPVFTLSSLERPPPGAATDAFERLGAPLLQAICCGTPRAAWSGSARGLSSTEAAINVALPECDGRIITVPVSFKDQHRYVPDAERMDRVADLARRLTVLRSKPNADKRIAVVLSNSGGKAQRIGGAVGLDTPASLLKWLVDMRSAGYTVGPLPESADDLMARILARGCYDDQHPIDTATALRMPRARYARWFHQQAAGFTRSVCETWGRPAEAGATVAPPSWRSHKQAVRRRLPSMRHEPFTDDADYLFSGLVFGNVLIAIQPPRGFGVDPEAAYHAPDLAPCHHYAAFYRWLADPWAADALVHFGTHGTMEWLPGKSLALSSDCAPDALLGDLPLVYPFVVNNPGEGAQAKRRTHAVIVDHLVPPLTHAGSHGPLETLARLVEEYYRAEVLDTNKLPVLRRQVWELVRSAKLEDDLRQIRVERHGDHQHAWDGRISEQGVPRALERLSGRGFAHLLEDLDAYLCDLGRAQIRGGLHVFGAPPEGAARVDLLFAILRSPNGGLPSLTDAVTRACGIDPDGLRTARGAWPHALHAALCDGASGAAGAPATSLGPSTATLTTGQVITRVDGLARDLLVALAEHHFSPDAIRSVIGARFASSDAVVPGDIERVLHFVCGELAPNLDRTTDETRNLLAALNGAHVPAGPSGSPSRGMSHVLPTGRNFYTVDPRGLPTPAAWATGHELAREALTRHRAQTGRWPESVALSVWGTPTLRTGGDDIAQALALLGARPIWEPETRRPSGLEIVPLVELGRPRVDVTLRVSGFFRDAFPALIRLFDDAVQRVVLLDEPPDQNFARKHWLADSAAQVLEGEEAVIAARRAAYRVFSPKPGAYGTGLMQLMDDSAWRDADDLAAATLAGGGWAHSAQDGEGVEAQGPFRRRLAGVELVLHNQDNLEQDMFDSSDWFEFHGGLVSAVSSLAGRAPQAYVGDSSDPSRPVVRTLQGQALRVFRARIVNPKWLEAMQRHGYRGGLEMASTVDALFGFSATAGIVTDWMFEGVAEHFADGRVREFLQRDNPWALHAIAERLLEAAQRGLWVPAPATLGKLQATLLDSESTMEAAAENAS